MGAESNVRGGGNESFQLLRGNERPAAQSVRSAKRVQIPREAAQGGAKAGDGENGKG